MQKTGRYDGQSELLDFIYGITFEIWEERGVELIRQYYGDEMELYSLSGISKGIEGVVQGTYDTLTAFPDRLLLPENVIWSDDRNGAYSSHRILSPMTNGGASQYGPATHKQVQVRTIADCLVQDGKIIREWLIRDTLPIVTQLGFDPLEAARGVALSYSDESKDWITSELNRIAKGQSQETEHAWVGFAQSVLEAVWINGDLESVFPHYVVLYPNPLECVSGLPAIREYAAGLRNQFADAQICVDHIAVQPWAHQGHEVAVRWTLKARHADRYCGLNSTEKEVLILGSSHWRVHNRQVLTDWTVYDGIGVLAQLV